jgi:2,3-bisphosphoglycerate-independent phosphoglycerate mutase
MADGVYVHLKGPDEPGHDGDQDAKIKAIENIDKYYLGALLEKRELKETAFIITCDHATPPSARGHTDDPVPFIIYSPYRRGDGMKVFTEREISSKGKIGTLNSGWKLLSLARKLIWG